MHKLRCISRDFFFSLKATPDPFFNSFTLSNSLTEHHYTYNYMNYSHSWRPSEGYGLLLISKHNTLRQL